jgi:hypothetical protein
MANPLAPVTLTADTVATFTLDGDYDTVEVLNGDGAAEVFFTVDGVAAPTVDGAGCYYLPSAIGSLAVKALRRDGATVIKCISTGTPKVAVRGIVGL